MNRRSLLGATAALVAVPAAQGVAAGMPSPDAELIEIGREALPLAQEFERVSEAIFRLPIGHPEQERLADTTDLTFDRLEVLHGRAAALPAATLGGFRAKAILLRHNMYIRCSSRSGMQFDGSDEECVWDFLTDLVEGLSA